MISVYFNSTDGTESLDNVFKYSSFDVLPFKLPQYKGHGSYIFPIKISTNISLNTALYNKDGTVSYHDEIISNDNYCINIPDNIINDTHKGICKIVFDVTDETYDVTHSNPRSRVLSLVKVVANTYNLNKNQILICTGNLTPFKDIDYASVCSLYIWADFVKAKKDLTQKQVELINYRHIREKKILMLMHTPYLHRHEVAEAIFKRGWLKDNIVSLYYIKERSNDYFKHLNLKFDTDYVNSLPWIVDITPLHKPRGKLFLNTQAELILYHQTYVNFTVDTFVENTSENNAEYEKDISEKVYKPITQMQPFVLYGQPGTLKLLKSHGYKTFDQWWDESYDNHSNKSDRLNQIVKLFDTINNMSHAELADMLVEMLPVLEHNKQHHKHLLDTGFYYKDFHDSINQLFNDK